MVNKKWFVGLFVGWMVVAFFAARPALAGSDAEQSSANVLDASISTELARAVAGPAAVGTGFTTAQKIHALLQNPAGPGHMSPETWVELFSLLPEESPNQQSAAVDTRNAE